MNTITESRQQSILERSQQNYIELPDGTRAHHTDLSFRKHIKNKHGKLIRTDSLFIPNECFSESYITGFKCFKELLEYKKNGGDIWIEVDAITDEVSNILTDTCSNKGHELCKRGAAFALIQCFVESIGYFAYSRFSDDWVDSKIEEGIRLMEHEKEQNKKRTESARKAKAYKKVQIKPEKQQRLQKHALALV